MNLHSTGGKARAASATRGSGGQFLPETQQEPSITLTGVRNHQHQQETKRSSSRKRSISKTLSLSDLPLEIEWWDALAEKYPGVDLRNELLKAMDWHRAHLVKSPKLFFRNWIERAYGAPQASLTADERRAQLGLVS